MIHYQLRCSAEHAFDGWFKDSVTFDRQAQLGLLSCPACGDVRVERALMTPSVARRRSGPTIELTPSEAPPTAPVPAGPPHAALAAIPDEMRAKLQRLRGEIEKHFDYVGVQFADEARRIHNGESDARGIYGETTPEEAAELAEDGIEVARIPWLPRADG